MGRFVLACAALILLAGCQSKPEPIEPTASAPTTRPASASPHPEANPPTLPAIAKRNDETGAANFVAYWVKAFNYAARTGDAAEMERFGSRCKACMRYADDFESLSPKQRIRDDAWTLSSVSVQKTDGGYDVEATVKAVEESTRYPLTFVLERDRPFQLVHIFERP
jgi:hypothetical protein